MKGIKQLNIWKTEEKQTHNPDGFLDAEITELNLSVRSYNCLKRANCNTIRDVLSYMGEDGMGLRRIRNLGSRSEKEIMERLEEHRALYMAQPQKSASKKVTIIKPDKRIWERKIDEFQLSGQALMNLKACGIHNVGDLYAPMLKSEPGWYAVRELFAVIPSCR